MNQHADPNGRPRSMLLLAFVIACWYGLASSNTALAMGADPPIPPAPPPQDLAPVGTTLRLTPDSGPPGTVVAIDGVGWPAGVYDVEAHWGVGGKSMLPMVLDVDQGVLDGKATIPDDASRGQDEAIEVCADYSDGVDTSTRCVSSIFAVDAEPEVEPELLTDPFEGQRGTVVEVSGRWANRSFETNVPARRDVPATVVWRPTGEALGAATISADGTVVAKVVIPLGAAVGAGSIAVCVDVPTGRGECAVTDFDVLGPTLEPDPTEANPGSDIRLTGTGWCCANADVAVTHSATGEPWGRGTIDDNGNLTAEATVPSNAVEGDVELEVCSGGDCRSTAVSVIPPEVPDTTAPPKTTDAPQPTDPPTTESPQTTDPTTTESPHTTDPATTDGPETTDPPIILPDPPDGLSEVLIPGLFAGGGAGLVVGGLVWHRFRRRRTPGVVPQVIPRPDDGRQSVLGHGGPAITVSAVLDIGHQKPTLHYRRTP